MPRKRKSGEEKKEKSNADKGRSPYKCLKCGLPKKGHICAEELKPAERSPRDSSPRMDSEEDIPISKRRKKSPKRSVKQEEDSRESTEEVEDVKVTRRTIVDPLENRVPVVTAVPAKGERTESIYAIDKNSTLSLNNSYLTTALLDTESNNGKYWFDNAKAGVTLLGTFFSVFPPLAIANWAKENKVIEELEDIAKRLDEQKAKYEEFAKTVRVDLPKPKEEKKKGKSKKK